MILPRGRLSPAPVWGSDGDEVQRQAESGEKPITSTEQSDRCDGIPYRGIVPTTTDSSIRALQV